jgi:hypothetical protein
MSLTHSRKATFLAAVQVQAISFTIDQNSTRLQIATNTLFFLGLFLDVLGGCAAYAGVTRLQRIHALIQKRAMDASAVTGALEKYKHSDPDNSLRPIIPTISQHLRFLDVMFLRVLDDIRLWTQVLQHLIHALDAMESFIYSLDNEHKGLREEVLYSLRQYRTTVNELAHRKLSAILAYSTNIIAPPTVLTGVLCFLSGMMCFLKESEPVAVWAPSFTAVVGVLLLLGIVVTILFRAV